MPTAILFAFNSRGCKLGHSLPHHAKREAQGMGIA
jgi:hypothetical protein